MNKLKQKCKICGGKSDVWYKELFDDRHGYPGLFDIYKCSQCGFAQTVPQLSPNKISQIYSKYYPRHTFDIKSVRKNDYSIIDKSKLVQKGLMTNCQYWVKSTKTNRKPKVLDVGCGLGYSLLELDSMGCQPYGIDPDKNATQIAKKFGFHFHRGFIEDKPFGKEKFDYVLASQVLEHVNNPQDFLRECKDRLKSEGEIVLSFPNANALSRKLLKRRWLHWHLPYHLNFFSRKSIELLANQVGLEIIGVKTITPNMWTNLQMRRLLIKPKMGEKDDFWEGGKPGLETKVTGFQFWFNYFLKGSFSMLENWNPLNRLIDRLGWGDSFVVICR